MTKRELVSKNQKSILALAAKHGICDVRLFGSVARAEEKVDSDIDLLVKLEQGRGAFDLMDFIDEVQALLGCKVDVLTDHRWMKEKFRAAILQDAIPLLPHAP